MRAQQSTLSTVTAESTGHNDAPDRLRFGFQAALSILLKVGADKVTVPVAVAVAVASEFSSEKAALLSLFEQFKTTDGGGYVSEKVRTYGTHT